MNSKQQTFLKILAVILLVLIIDQGSKVWIKTNMTYGEEFLIMGQQWARIHFVENNGMAFGLDFGGYYGKLFLSLFRIAAVVALSYYLTILVREKARFGFLLSFALILAGAIGNILDSTFYGVLFSESPYHGGLATMFPEEGGYAGFLHGKVVDMFYFPMFEGFIPDWVPFIGGDSFMFFRPVFNVADAAITTGVISILLFHRDYFSNKPLSEAQEQGSTDTAAGGTAASAALPEEPDNAETAPDADTTPSEGSTDEARNPTSPLA